jgi:cyclic pyranopterin phosphate synthase
MSGMTHLNEGGEARMVDVGAKESTRRVAVAEAFVRMAEGTRAQLADGAKGDALAVARVAGIQGAKATSSLIPLCHPLALSGVRVLATAQTTGPTGVEMEAMCAASTAALTLYDMLKGVERGIEITSLRLLEKSGGRSGHWVREA